ncbi:hypothetical protein [Pectobacterium odoriferum]|uniref:hypothetical protein n=1 Tax=Pectobacterium odoriferum TaxID=78398 RepID=UPI0005062ABA|nr:hypothetical protein [Pectobacterium odoriferum]KGA30253.1 hypothetical protein KS43_20445 [Pectobacterium odoriferum]
MSLETHLARNNELVAQQNDLITRLLNAIISGAGFSHKVDQTPTSPEKAGITETTPALDIETLDFDVVIALAGLYPQAQEITAEQIEKAVAYQSATGDSRIVQIDALRMALSAPPMKHAHKQVLLLLARAITSHWDALKTIGERRAFAESWLKSPPEERHLVAPKVDKKKNRVGPFFYKHPESDAIGAVDTEEDLEAVLADQGVEISKVEYLQLKEAIDKATPNPADDTPDFAALRKQAEGLILRLAKSGYRSEAVAILEKFRAKKLGQVGDEHITEVVALAEKALEG